MLIKFKSRWYVDPIIVPGLGFALHQTTSPITIAHFGDLDEAMWVCEKLNSGRYLCEAVRNFINHDDWLKRDDPKVLVDDLIHCLTVYMQGNT